jgi:ABC-2 type transport system permease protein
MRLDWENEVEVIKQGAAVTIYLLPNLIVVIGLTVLSVFLGTCFDLRLIAVCFTAIAAILAALSYRRVMVLSKKP